MEKRIGTPGGIKADPITDYSPSYRFAIPSFLNPEIKGLNRIGCPSERREDQSQAVRRTGPTFDEPKRSEVGLFISAAPSNSVLADGALHGAVTR
jgi:hypothetical protein